MKDRVQRINSLIMKELGQIILKELTFPDGVLSTITRVETSSNKIESKVYVSVFPEKMEEVVFHILKSNLYFLQKALDKRLRMRPVPKLRIIPETETIEADKVERILEEIKEQ
jgi:ribosome-binding factor A